MAVNLAIATGLFWSSIWTILTLASPAATVDLRGLDEISENYPVSFVFSSLNQKNNNHKKTFLASSSSRSTVG